MFTSLPDDKSIVDRYVKAGMDFGDAASDVGTWGECVGFDGLLNKWEDSEEAYAGRGYRTLSVDAFIDVGGWGKPLVGLRERRDLGEEPILHAAYYREHYLGKVPAVLMQSFEVLEKGQVFSGTYNLPSTAHLTPVRRRVGEDG